ncbi:MAG: nucleoside recognition domain-containing protein [bacterium]|nr:nucleoside recognition domain-containing protein [bacterium]MDT8395956.1 nucleoside recognition domain-containing protein [bacterium]
MNRAVGAIRAGTLTGLSTSWTLLKVMVPTIILVQVLKVTGLLGLLASAAEPLMGIFKLPGEAALVLITGGMVNIYAAIAVAVNIPLTARGMTVLAVMVLIAHNLIVETAVQRKAGTPARIILPARITAALLAGLIFSRLVPEKGGLLVQAGLPTDGGRWTDILAGNILSLAKIVVIIVSLMILVESAREFGILDRITRALGPPMKLLGMDRRTSFVAAVGLLLGLAYGAGLIIEETRKSDIGGREILATNIFLGTSHALIEDSLIFAAVGAGLGWVVIGRLIFSVVFLKLSMPVVMALWKVEGEE